MKEKKIYMRKYDDNLLLQYWQSGLGISQIRNKYGGTNLRKRLIDLGIREKEIDLRTEQIKKEQMKLNRIKNQKQIFQYDLKGNYINSFNSIKEASDFYNFEYSAITHCVLGDIPTARGYIWLDKNDKNELQNRLKRIKGSKKEVNQYDLNNNYVQTFPSIAEATRRVNGKSSSPISTACNKGGGKAYGFLWKFANE